MLLTISATLLLSGAKMENSLATSIKKGAPGGWPTISLKADAMYSPQSQKLTVGSMPISSTVAAIRKMIQPVIVLTFLNRSMAGCYYFNIQLILFCTKIMNFTGDDFNLQIKNKL